MSVYCRSNVGRNVILNNPSARALQERHLGKGAAETAETMEALAALAEGAGDHAVGPMTRSFGFLFHVVNPRLLSYVTACEIAAHDSCRAVTWQLVTRLILNVAARDSSDL
jgi:hypothetical protein